MTIPAQSAQYKWSRSAATALLCVVACGVTALCQSASSTDAGTRPFRNGDALRIVVWPDTLAMPNGVYPIDKSGRIELPIVGRLDVASMSAESLVVLVKNRYVEHMRIPNATVYPLIRLALVGGYHAPGMHYVDPRMSLWDAVALAGGPVRDDGCDRIRWVRNGIELDRDLTRKIASGASLDSLGFASGDELRLTNGMRRQFHEVLTGTILPIVSFVVTMGLTGITVNQLYGNQP